MQAKKEIGAMNLENRNVIITGGYRGIGKEIANVCAKIGTNVFIIARKLSQLGSALNEIEMNKIKGTQRFASYSLDVSDEKAVTNWTHDFIKDFGSVDILINNAGIAYVDHIEKTTIDDFKKVMSIDYFGVINLTKHILPHMIEKKNGYVENCHH
jgi:NADP-dependent 3-hydroxy acid dehydrogenase YdfG